jgi:hypothetical protein
MESEGSSLCSKQPATGPYPILTGPYPILTGPCPNRSTQYIPSNRTNNTTHNNKNNFLSLTVSKETCKCLENLRSSYGSQPLSILFKCVVYCSLLLFKIMDTYLVSSVYLYNFISFGISLDTSKPKFHLHIKVWEPSD